MQEVTLGGRAVFSLGHLEFEVTMTLSSKDIQHAGPGAQGTAQRGGSQRKVKASHL